MIARAAVPSLSIRGKLVQTDPARPTLEVDGHKLVHLSGDADTLGVLNDARLAGKEIETLGHFTAPDHFEVDPIHTSAMYIHQDGKRWTISYWCDVCAIRTYTPGICVCCQKYTDLDLREPDQH